MEEFYEKCPLQKLTQNDFFKKWNSSMPIKEIEFIIENFPTMKMPGQIYSLMNSNKKLKRNVNLYT